MATISPQGNICNVCNNAISGKIVSALGKTWHPEHFTCANCSSPITGDKFNQKDNLPWCSTCYTAKHLKTCKACNQPIHDGAVIGTAVSILTVTWIILGAQAHIAQGHIRFPYMDLNTEECPNQNFTSDIISNSTHEPKHSNNEAPWPYRISYMYYTPIGAIIVIIIGTIVSFITEHPGYVKPSFLSPLIRRWVPKEELVDYASVRRELTAPNQ